MNMSNIFQETIKKEKFDEKDKELLKKWAEEFKKKWSKKLDDLQNNIQEKREN